MGIPKMESDGLAEFLDDWKRIASGQPLSERPEEREHLQLVRDLSTAEADAEDAGIIRADMTLEQRCESLANHVHDMLGRERVLRNALAESQRELDRMIVAQSPIQELGQAYPFETMSERAGELFAAIQTAEALGHQVGVRFYREANVVRGISLGVRVIA